MKPSELKNICSLHSYSKNGDKYEQDFCNTFIGKFPNHQEFWKYFVIPCTNRVDTEISNTDPKKIRFRKVCPIRLQRISQAHYSIFMHLAYILNNKNNLNQKDNPAGIYMVENLFSHLRSVFDLTDNLFFHITVLLYGSVGIFQESSPDFLSEISKISEKELTNEYEKEKQEYAIKFSETYLEKGIPIIVHFNTIHPVVKYFFSRINIPSDIAKEYFTGVKQSVGKYRNYFQHNQLLGQCIDTEGQIWIPKPSKLEEYTLWSNVFDDIFNMDKRKKNFVVVQTMLESLLDKTFDNLNSIWEKTLQFLLSERVYSHLLKVFTLESASVTATNLFAGTNQASAVNIPYIIPSGVESSNIPLDDFYKT